MIHITWRVDPAHRDTIHADLTGTLDPDAARRLGDELLPQLGPEAPKLLLDMRQIEWMGSAGVGSLMRLLARAQTHGGALALFGCNPRVLSVLQVCGLEEILNVCDSEAAARQRLESRKSS